MKKNVDVLGRIYKIKNNINGKVYIGQTIRSISERWSGHKCDSLKRGRETAIANAIRKYGYENFEIELLEDDIPYKDLDFKEIYYIEKYNSVSPNGYNISSGGQTYRTEEERMRMADRVMGEKNPMYGACGELNPFYGKQHTEETKNILSRKKKEVWNNMSKEEYDEHVAFLAEMGKRTIELYGGGFAGKSHTEESKNKISSKLKGKVFSEEHNKKISENSAKKQKVVMLDKDGNHISEFDSMTKACTYLKENGLWGNPKPGEISNVCRKARNTAYGYIWLYYEDYINGNYEIKIKYKKESKKLICLNNNLIFDTFISAGEFANTSGSSVWACCNKTQKTAGKSSDGTPLLWMYYDEYLKLNKNTTKGVAI